MRSTLNKRRQQFAWKFPTRTAPKLGHCFGELCGGRNQFCFLAARGDVSATQTGAAYLSVCLHSQRRHLLPLAAARVATVAFVARFGAIRAEFISATRSPAHNCNHQSATRVAVAQAPPAKARDEAQRRRRRCIGRPLSRLAQLFRRRPHRNSCKLIESGASYSSRKVLSSFAAQLAFVSKWRAQRRRGGGGGEFLVSPNWPVQRNERCAFSSRLARSFGRNTLIGPAAAVSRVHSAASENFGSRFALS